tara:strand:+ start:886 stop:1071 length:186 start_codon:yes stop_codon:yes gene_type:complete
MTNHLPIVWHKNTSGAVGEQHIMSNIFSSIIISCQHTILAVVPDGYIISAVLLDAEQGANL